MSPRKFGLSRFAPLASVFIAIGLSNAPASASMIYWTNPNGGNFNTASNWSTGKVPTPTDDISLPPLGKRYTVTCKNDLRINSAYIGNAFPLHSYDPPADSTNGPVLNVGAYTFGSGLSQIQVSLGGTLIQSGGRVFGLLSVAGEYQVRDGAVGDASILGTGHMSVSGNVSFGNQFFNRGLVEVGPTQTAVTLYNTQVYNYGTWEMSGASGSSFSNSSSTCARFLNIPLDGHTGVFRKRGSSTLEIKNVAFPGTGQLDLQGGVTTLKLQLLSGTGAIADQVKVAQGATFRVFGLNSSSPLDLSAQLSGDGTVGIESGVTTSHFATIACKRFYNRGDMRLSGLTVAAGASFDNYGLVRTSGTDNFKILAGGTMTMWPHQTTDPNVPQSTLTASPFIQGTLNWRGGSYIKDANILAGGLLKISGTDLHVMQGTVANSGTIEWTGGNIYSSTTLKSGPSGGEIPYPDGTFQNLDGGLIRIHYGGTTDFTSTNPNWTNTVNGKILVNLTPGRTCSISCHDFPNQGLIQVDSGIFSLAGVHRSSPVSTLGQGKFYVKGTVKSAAADTSFSVNADVTLDSPSATVLNASGVNLLPTCSGIGIGGLLTITGGKNLAVGGDFSNRGVLKIDPASSLGLTAAQRKFIQPQGFTVLNGGTLSTTGTGTVTVTDGTLMGSGTVSSTLLSGDGLSSVPFAYVAPGLADGSPAPGASAGRIQVARGFTQNVSSLNAQIGGTDTTIPQYDQLRVSGKVFLGGDLAPSFVNGFQSHFGDTFTLIDNDGTDPIIGTFRGAGEGTLYPVGARKLRLSYKGGDGNDVTLRDTVQASVTPISVAEPNTGSTNATFTVTLDPAPAEPVTIAYNTVDGAAAVADYAPVSGTLSFAPGEASKTINVPILGDVLDEDDETFSLVLHDAVNTELLVPSAICTILDNDVSPTLSIKGASVREADSGTVPLPFVITLSAVSGRPVSAVFSTGDASPVSAIAGVDYEPVTGQTVTFAPGETTQTVNVIVPCDTAFEGNRTFWGLLSSPVNATLKTENAQGTINENDPTPTLSVADITLPEGTGTITTAIFTITLAGSAGRPVTVNYATAPGTADNSDFTATSGQLTFAPGETSKTVPVEVIADSKTEAAETFTLTLSQPSFSRITRATAAATITNDDAAAARTSGRVF